MNYLSAHVCSGIHTRNTNLFTLNSCTGSLSAQTARQRLISQSSLVGLPGLQEPLDCAFIVRNIYHLGFKHASWIFLCFCTTRGRIANSETAKRKLQAWTNITATFACCFIIGPCRVCCWLGFFPPELNCVRLPELLLRINNRNLESG